MSSLNPAQTRAVNHTEGPLLILAGAGAGKTRVITERIINLIRGGAAPESILAITFTNKAAEEMRERVLGRLAADTELRHLDTTPLLTTFHSLGVLMIKENAARLGLTRHFTIFDRDDSIRGIKRALRELDYDPKQYDPKKILNVISRAKGDFQTLRDFRAHASGDYFREIVALVWEGYERILTKEKACDFDDLLLKPALLLRDHSEVRTHYQNRWHYLHVDEYQDTNTVQYEITRLLAEREHNICVVGDIDQNIYSWRGANFKNIFNFEQDFPEHTSILLEQNYRSTKRIIDSANQVIKKNENRKEKNLFTENEEGEPLHLYLAYDGPDEARYVVMRAAELIEANTPPSEIAVLFRANYQSRLLEEAFLHSGIPYQVLGTRFFDRAEIKDVLSFVRLALNPESVTDLERVINVPPRGIGKVTLLKLITGKEAELNSGMKTKVAAFRDLLNRIAEAASVHSVSDTLKYVIKESGIEKTLLEGSEDEKERLENIRELVTLAKKYEELPGSEGLERLLEDASLATDQDSLTENRPGVKLMTVHAAKGLEFDYVFITGLEQGLFPHQGLDERSLSKDGKEEERRLFYVALTRARKQLFLTAANIRTIFGSAQVNVPSEFIQDIPEEHLVIQAATDNSDLAEKGGDEPTVYLEW